MAQAPAEFNDVEWARFESKILYEPNSGCWIWTATSNGVGYGTLTLRKEHRYAHRVAYEHLVGPIPDGLELDHLCRNPRCCNPEHLEAVTHRENSLRGESLAAQRAKVTACVAGHAFDEANTYNYRGHRWCRACHRRRQRERYQRQCGPGT